MPLPPLVPRAVLFGNPEKTAPQISPDGKRLSFLAPHPEHGTLNVWVQTIGQDDARPVTHDATRPVRRYRWAWDNRHLLYFQDEGGDENWHLFAVDLDDLENPARDLTPFPKTVASIAGTSLRQPNTLLVTLNKREPTLFDVYELTLPDGDLTLREENPGDVVSYVADQDLKIRACLARTPDGFSFQLRLRENTEDDWRTVMTWGPDDQGGPWGFTEDGMQLYISSNLNADTTSLRLYDLALGTESILAERPGVDVSGALTHPVSRAVQAVSFNRAREEWQILDAAVQPDFEALEQLRPGEEFSVADRSLDDKTWLVSFMADNGPVRYYAWDRASQTPTFLFTGG